MWGLKYARDTELARLATAEDSLAVLKEDHNDYTVTKCEASVIDLERRIIDRATDTLNDVSCGDSATATIFGLMLTRL